eukprot:2831255-Lingulodinium_polyedra.AAC.1
MPLPLKTAPGVLPVAVFLLAGAAALPLAWALPGAVATGAGTEARSARAGPAHGTHQLRRLACPVRRRSSL